MNRFFFAPFRFIFNFISDPIHFHDESPTKVQRNLSCRSNEHPRHFDLHISTKIILNLIHCWACSRTNAVALVLPGTTINWRAFSRISAQKFARPIRVVSRFKWKWAGEVKHFFRLGIYEYDDECKMPPPFIQVNTAPYLPQAVSKCVHRHDWRITLNERNAIICRGINNKIRKQIFAQRNTLPRQIEKDFSFWTYDWKHCSGPQRRYSSCIWFQECCYRAEIMTVCGRLQ